MAERAPRDRKAGAPTSAPVDHVASLPVRLSQTTRLRNAIGELENALRRGAITIPAHAMNLRTALAEARRADSRDPSLEARASAVLARANAPRPLPSAIRGELECATGTSLADVRVHDGDEGERVATAHAARGVAIGRDIYIHPDHFDVESADGRELIAHEVAHVAQASVPGAGSIADAEQEADDFASRFRAGAIAGWRPRVGVAGAMRSPSDPRAAEVAKVQYQLTVAEQRNTNVNAPSYLHVNFTDVRNACADFLGAHLHDVGDPDVSFTTNPGALIEVLLDALDRGDLPERIERLRTWIAPVDLFALVDRSRSILEDGEADTSHNKIHFGAGPKGPTQYRPLVGTVIGSQLDLRVAESLRRLAPRLIAASREGTPSERDLVYSHPIDVHVGRGMLAHCTVRTISRRVQRTSYRKVQTYEWMGRRGGPWNAVHPLDPPDANVEEIAAAVIGRSTEAYRITQIGPYFVIPPDIAREFPDATSGISPASVQPVQSTLAFGPLGSVAQAFEGEKHAIDATADQLAARWQHVDEQLSAIAYVVAPYGLGLASSRAHHAAQRGELSALVGHDAAVRAGVYDNQSVLLARVASAISNVLAAATKAPSTKGQTNPSMPVLGRAIEVASVSHLVETGQRAWDAFIRDQKYLIVEHLERQLGDAATQIEVIRRTSELSSQASARSRALSKDNFQHRADELAARVIALRTGVLHDRVDPAEVARVQASVESLRTETTLVAQIGELGA
jgi:hypothetical protein